jgi:ankyrin repeat protein
MSPSSTTRRRNRRLWEAALAADVETVRSLLSAGADVNARHPEHHETPLMLAVQDHSGRGVPVASLLLESGAAVDAVDLRGRTALLSAAPPYLALLLAAGADVAARDLEGRTALMWAAEREYPAAAIATLLAHGAELEVADPDGLTALMYAAVQANRPAVLTLLEQGADVNAADHLGGTCLAYAVYSGDPDTVRVLLDAGADPDAVDRHGRSPRQLARDQGPPAVRALFDALPPPGRGSGD